MTSENRQAPHGLELGARRILDIGDRIFMAIAVLAVVAMVVSVTADAIGRYLFSNPLSGNYEFTSLFAMVALTFMGMPRTYATGGHIRLEVFAPALSRIPWHLSERLNVLFGAVAFGLLAWVSGQEAIHKFAVRETTLGTIQFPIYWSYVWVPLGSAWLTLRLVLELFFPQEKQAAEPLE